MPVGGSESANIADKKEARRTVLDHARVRGAGVDGLLEYILVPSVYKSLECKGAWG